MKKVKVSLMALTIACSALFAFTNGNSMKPLTTDYFVTGDAVGGFYTVDNPRSDCNTGGSIACTVRSSVDGLSAGQQFSTSGTSILSVRP